MNCLYVIYFPSIDFMTHRCEVRSLNKSIWGWRNGGRAAACRFRHPKVRPAAPQFWIFLGDMTFYFINCKTITQQLIYIPLEFDPLPKNNTAETCADVTREAQRLSSLCRWGGLYRVPALQSAAKEQSTSPSFSTHPPQLCPAFHRNSSQLRQLSQRLRDRSH